MLRGRVGVYRYAYAPLLRCDGLDAFAGNSQKVHNYADQLCRLEPPVLVGVYGGGDGGIKSSSNMRERHIAIASSPQNCEDKTYEHFVY